MRISESLPIKPEISQELKDNVSVKIFGTHTEALANRMKFKGDDELKALKKLQEDLSACRAINCQTQDDSKPDGDIPSRFINTNIGKALMDYEQILFDKAELSDKVRELDESLKSADANIMRLEDTVRLLRNQIAGKDTTPLQELAKLRTAIDKLEIKYS